jgi:hypothetical protein
VRRAIPTCTLAAALACSPADRPAVVPPDSAGPAPAAPADSLVLTLPIGATVWYTLARDARAADGTSCVERGLEVRHGGTRVAVPLLYTRDIPTAAGDSTIEARLYLNCAPGDRYRVNTRTGQPTPIR